MSTIIRWFYCLPAYRAVLFLLLCLSIFLLVMEHIPGTAYRRLCSLAAFLLTLFVIFRITLYRETGVRALYAIPFTSWRRAFTDNGEYAKIILMNILLFVPFGFTLKNLLEDLYPGKTHWPAVLFLGCLLSICIEYAQWHCACGITETDDVINNSIGTLTGIAVLKILRSSAVNAKTLIHRTGSGDQH